MITPSIKFKLQKYLFIIFFWVFSMNLYVLIAYFGNDSNNIPSPFLHLIITASFGGLFMGIIIGMMEIFIYPRLIKNKSFIFNIILRTTGFIIILLVLIISLTIIYNDVDSYEKRLIKSWNYVSSISFLTAFLYFLFISSILDLILQVNRRMGPGSILNLLNGAYYRPKVENRIFMFLDLQSSTAIAESLGHVKFSNLLQDCFHDLSKLLLKHHAKVYQFVGDEAVLTWDIINGFKKNNCVNIFFEYQKLLQSKSYSYIKKYGIAPEFLASINAGKVTVAQVGDIKSELAYHGDVLNTAARIQKLCKVYGEKILMTRVVAEKLNSIRIKKLDTVSLNGKNIYVELYTIVNQ